MDAVIPAAGEGTRLRPLTADQPKALVEVAGRPLLAHVFDALAPAGHEQYVVVIGYRGDQIVDHFGTSYDETPVEYVRQAEPRGLAHAVLQADPVVDDSFLVCNGDNVFGSGLTNLACEHEDRDGEGGAVATLLVEEATRERAKTTGVVVTDDAGRVQRVVEKPDDPPTTLVSAGAFAFSQGIFDACRAIEPSERDEYELSDAITWLVEQGKSVRALPFERERINVNTPSDVDAAAESLSNQP